MPTVKTEITCSYMKLQVNSSIYYCYNQVIHVCINYSLWSLLFVNTAMTASLWHIRSFNSVQTFLISVLTDNKRKQYLFE